MFWETILDVITVFQDVQVYIDCATDSSSQEDLRQKLQCSDHEWEYISQESGLELDYKRYINNPNNVHRLITTAYNIEVLPYLNAGKWLVCYKCV